MMSGHIHGMHEAPKTNRVTLHKGPIIPGMAMQALRRVVPGRPASAAPSGEGFLAILGDAASSIVCGGAAGTIMQVPL